MGRERAGAESSTGSTPRRSGHPPAPGPVWGYAALLVISALLIGLAHFHAVNAREGRPAPSGAPPDVAAERPVSSVPLGRSDAARGVDPAASTRWVAENH